MATQNLNEVQRAYINGTCRPMIERLIKLCDELDSFLLEAANQQTPITNNGDDLGDGASGTAPRTDAPKLTGAQIASLVTFATNLRAQINASALNTLVSVAVRDVATINAG